MSKTRVYKQETLDIQQRYFDLIQELINNRRIPGGLTGFCESYGIDRRHFYTQRSNLNRGYFEVAWILPLIKHYNVSATWLLFGTGNRFRRTDE